MNMKSIFSKREGRSLEFKSYLPKNADLAKTVVAFANDAGGEIFLGVDDEGGVTGLDENDLPKIEEEVSSLIYDRCYPAILPEITFLSSGDKHVIRIKVFSGSTPPYYLKSEGKMKGTYIRVGSTNRLADKEIIQELERKRRNISFDGETVLEKEAKYLDLRAFKKTFNDKTGEDCTLQALRKLSLVKKEQGKDYPVNALVLLSDDELRDELFPNAKIECARFKGTGSDEFIDRKSITGGIAAQAEEAYKFVLRNINNRGKVEGVYTISRWEYPVKAIREIIRNAVVHRQYSLTGMSIKIAIYDDMVEVTSPGLLPPSIDYSAMESRQSDARNKILAPVFKKLGIIDQWGNGLKLVAEEMKKYPEIEFRWQEVGLSFQVQFVKKGKPGLVSEYVGGYGSTAERNKVFAGGDGTIYDGSIGESGRYEPVIDNNKYIKERIISMISDNAYVTINEMADRLGLSKRNCERIIASLRRDGSIRRIGPSRTGRWEVKENN
jgi:ATP-dependent DNA helicase RecG